MPMALKEIDYINLEGIDESSVFACGADMKNRFCLLHKGRVYLSEDNGDLSEPQNFHRYIDSIRKITSGLNFTPDIVAHDLHPMYLSTNISKIFEKAQHLSVQHHHAHIASIMATSPKTTPVIGISLDGTGYGLDGNLWGGEFLVVSQQGLERHGHLKYMGMPGGEKAIHQPWRMIFSLLYGELGDGALKRNFDFLKIRPQKEYQFLKEMIARKVNLPMTSSCGRLFDAVSSLLGITHVVRFEAEAAINLEREATAAVDSASYAFDIEKDGDVYIIGYRSMLKAIIGDMEAGVPKHNIARRFHNSLSQLILDMAEILKRETGLNRVVLSGGVFQNKILYEGASRLLREAGFEILTNNDIPLSDLGICIGQLYVAINSKVCVTNKR